MKKLLLVKYDLDNDEGKKKDCCVVFRSKNPKIKSRLEEIIRYESALDIEKLVEDSVAMFLS